MQTIPLSLDGYTDLPPGRIANVVTYFEMRHWTIGSGNAPLPPGYTVRRIIHPDVAQYRELYRRIGHDWMWFSRLRLTDEALAAALGRLTTEVHFLERDREPIGLAEIRRSEDGKEAEISLFGVVPEVIGTGSARALLSAVLDIAWSKRPDRVWLHTCSFDHPAAVPFYSRMGFTPYKFAIEVTEDPRLNGLMPRTAGPHVALIDPPRSD